MTQEHNTTTIDKLILDLSSKLVSNDVYLNTEVLNELTSYIDHIVNMHHISLFNVERLINGFMNIKIAHRDIKDRCDYVSMLQTSQRCLLSNNWGKQKKFNTNNESINITVFKYFSSSILHFINGFNDIITPELPTNEINSNSVVLFNNKPVLKALVCSKFVTETELKEFSKTYDLVIHGISRILKAEEFTENLIKLALMGVKQISIPDNKESETRLFRDFDKEATGNLMLLTSLIDVKIGGQLIKSEQQVLNYCSIASKTTSSSQLADIRKIQYEWVEGELNANKSLNKTMGHFKGSFNKVLTRAINVERCRNNKEVINFFKNNLQAKIALVDDKVLTDCIKTSINRALLRISEKLDVTPNTLMEFFKFDKEELLNQFKELMQDIEINVITCRVDECDTQAFMELELCLNHLKDAQDQY